MIYTEINSWAKQGFDITTDLRYIMKSSVTNEVLFERSCHLYLDLSVSNSEGGAFGALFALAASAINIAATEHITAARKANYYILRDMPRGKYSPDYFLIWKHLQKKEMLMFTLNNVAANRVGRFRLLSPTINKRLKHVLPS